MSRPKPTIIMSNTDKKNFRTKEITKADAVYAVFYEGQPIGVRSESYAYQSHRKYYRSTYATPATAINCAKRLNKQFDTDKFQAVKLTGGEPITE
jgi:hypothetical protein